MAPPKQTPKPAKLKRRAPRPGGKPWHKSSSATSVYAFAALAAFLGVALFFLTGSSPAKSAPAKPRHVSKPVQVTRSWKRTAEGPGRGVVATEPISKGTLIMLDTPFIGVPEMENRTLAGEILLSRVARLSPTAKLDYFNLPFTPNRLPQEVSDAQLAANIFESNAVRAGTTSTVFKNSAYIAHSCDPNADFFYRDDLEALVVHAMRDIKAGEEITAPHFDAVALTREQRQDYMIETRGHECTCPVCSAKAKDVEQSDARRAQLGAIKQLMREWSEGIAASSDVLTAVEIAYQLLDEEHYAADLGWWAGNAVQVCAAHEDAECTTKWAKVAAEYYSVIAGSDSPQVRNLNIIAATPERANAWGKRIELESADSLEFEGGEESEVEETLVDETGSESETETETETAPEPEVAKEAEPVASD